ncbi:MAG: creatininase family protein [Chloroflexota bacterium]|jgi:creatinine amidohydrolase
MNIKDVAWVDVQEKLRDTDLLNVPLGATETYGPHLVMGTEGYIGDYVGKELGNRLDRLVASFLPVACSELLVFFPGNLYTSPYVLKAYVKAISDRMIFWGITGIIFLNIYSPNMALLGELSREYLQQGISCMQVDFWRFILNVGSRLLGEEPPVVSNHASEMATAVVLAVDSDLVFESRFSRWTPNITLIQQYPDVATYRSFKDEIPESFIGDPGKATAEERRELLK